MTTDAPRPAAVATLLNEDDRVRVTRFEFAPGAETGWHRHEMDYVIVALTDCTMRLREPGPFERITQIGAGETYLRKTGVEHNVINDGNVPMGFIEIELK